MADNSTPIPAETAYSAVFRLAQESIQAGAPGLSVEVRNAIGRSIARKLVERKLAPAAYGDKREPYYTGAAIGLEGMSVNLAFPAGTAELVFREDEVDLVNEEGQDLYIARLPASEVLELRQALIDYLPAAEGVAPRVEVRAPSPEAMKAAVELEIEAAIGRVTTQGIGALIDRVADARVAAALAQQGAARG